MRQSTFALVTIALALAGGVHVQSGAHVLVAAEVIDVRRADIDRTTQALREAEGAYDGSELAVRRLIAALDGAAGAVRGPGDGGLARKYYQRSLELKQQLFGAVSIEVAEHLEEMTSAYALPQEHSEVVRHLKQALNVRESLFGPGDPRIAPSLELLGQRYKSQGNWREAERQYARAAQVCENARLGDRSETCRHALWMWSNALRALGREAEADAAHERYFRELDEERTAASPPA